MPCRALLRQLTARRLAGCCRVDARFTLAFWALALGRWPLDTGPVGRRSPSALVAWALVVSARDGARNPLDQPPIIQLLIRRIVQTTIKGSSIKFGSPRLSILIAARTSPPSSPWGCGVPTQSRSSRMPADALAIHKPSALVSFGLPDPLSFQVRSHAMVARRSGTNLDREASGSGCQAARPAVLGMQCGRHKNQSARRQRRTGRSPMCPRHFRWPRTRWSIWLLSLPSRARFCSPFWPLGVFETCRIRLVALAVCALGPLHRRK